MPVHNEEVYPNNARLAGLVRGEHERHLDKIGLETEKMRIFHVNNFIFQANEMK